MTRKSDIESDSDSDDKIQVVKRVSVQKSKTKCQLLSSSEENRLYSNPKYNKKKMNECQMLSSSDEEGKDKKKKKKKKKRVFIYKPKDLSSEYVGKLLGIQEKTVKAIEKKILTTEIQFLLSPCSRFKNAEEAVYFIVTRKIMKYECSVCQLPPVWNDNRLPLLLDFMDNMVTNYSKENLRFMCPNCLTQEKGKYSIAKYFKESNKKACLKCKRELPIKKIKGGKCLDCIETETNEKIISNDYNYKKYKKQNSDFDVNQLLPKKITNMDGIDVASLITTQQHIENEDRKSLFNDEMLKSMSELIGPAKNRPHRKKGSGKINLSNIPANMSPLAYHKMLRESNKNGVKQDNIGIDIIEDDRQPPTIEIEIDDKNKNHSFTFD
jgi:Zn finger protein HypA/HybF involved in hydrogenase expression